MVVVPAPTVVITPLARMVATAELLLVQELDGVVASCKVLAVPIHCERAPVMPAIAFTVTLKPLAHPVPSV